MMGRQSGIIANVQRLHEHMDRDGCAALVVRSGTNVTYLAGFAYPGTLARHLDFLDSPREVLLVWPRHDEPVLIVNHYAAPLTRRDSWPRRLEISDDYAESPYARIAEVLTQLGLDRKTMAGDVCGPDERVDLTTAIRMHTINGAFASFEEGFKGSLEVGKAADLALLAEHLSRVPVERLRDVGVAMTVVGGEVVYEG